jgi:hypothetical protein
LRCGLLSRRGPSRPDLSTAVEGGTQAKGALSMRSLKITTADDIASPALHALIEAAVADRAATLES